jgi:hypothetical protein
MAVKIQFRRGTAAEWAAANPTLSSGELGYEVDTLSFKIGDGSTTWNSLDYSAVSADYVDSAIANVIGLAPETLDTLTELAAAIGDDPDFANTINSNINNAISESNDYSDSAVSTHNSETESVHGIANTAALETSSGAQSKADAAQANAESYSDSAVSTHNSETESVHGIANTAALETSSGAQSKADAAQANAQSYADNAVANLVDSAPGTLDTLNELAAALGDDPNFATTIANTLATKLTFVIDSSSNFNESNLITSANTIYIASDLPGYPRLGDGVNVYNDLEVVGGAYADAGIAEHNETTENVHGIANTSELVTESQLNSAIGTHSTVETDVHGIANTAELATTSMIQGLEDSKLSITTAELTYAPLSDPTFVNSATLPENTSIGSVSSAEILHLNGATSSIQDQLDAKAPLANATLTGTVSLPSTTSIGDVSATEIGYLDGVTSGIQGQIDGKENTITGAATTITQSNLTASRALASDVSGKVEVSAVTTTELGYVSGVTSSIQTQLDAKLPLSGGTMTGFITLHDDPTQALHAATKEYVDSVSAGILTKPAVVAATTANLTATYNNGTNGVGATLNLGQLATLDVDGVTTWTLLDGILVKDQTDPAENGRYVLDQIGNDTDTDWVLRRCSLCDTADEIPGSYIFVLDGTVNGQTAWVLHVDDPATFVVGTDDIDAFQFAGAGTVTAGNNITVVGSQVSVSDSPTFTGTVSLPSTTSIGDVSATEIGYLDGVTSGIQGQIDAKAPTANPSFTGNVVVSSSNGVVFADGTQTKQGVPSITVITPKTASYTLSGLGERDTVIEISNTSATTLTVPLNSSVAYPIGTTIDIIQTNTGQVTIAGAAGVTVNATPGLKLRARWSSATLLKRGTDSWLAFGDLSA